MDENQVSIFALPGIADSLREQTANATPPMSTDEFDDLLNDLVYVSDIGRTSDVSKFSALIKADRAELLARVAELEAENQVLRAWVREALPYLKDTQRFLTYVPEGGLWHEFGGVITCGEKLLEGADG